MMPLEIGWAFTVSWKAGDAMCRIMAFFRTFGLYLSSFVLVCISIDRYVLYIQQIYHISFIIYYLYLQTGDLFRFIILKWFFFLFIYRYLAILKPLHLSGIDKRGKIMIFTAWMASCICSSPQVIIYLFFFNSNICL